MRAVRYLVCAVAAFAVVLGVMFWCGTFFPVFFDLPSLLITVGLPLVLLRAGWTFRGMGAAFRNALSDGASAEEIAESARFFIAARRYLTGAAAFGLLVGTIGILTNLADKTKLGPAFALALLSAFYAVVLILVVCLPLEIASRRKTDVR